VEERVEEGQDHDVWRGCVEEEEVGERACGEAARPGLDRQGDRHPCRHRVAEVERTIGVV
jgi:hypothetical protein